MASLIVDIQVCHARFSDRCLHCPRNAASLRQHGCDYDPAAVTRLIVGMSQDEVRALLGPPSTQVTLADGTQHWIWLHSRGNMLGRGDAGSVTLLFGADGRYFRTLSQVETHIR